MSLSTWKATDDDPVCHCNNNKSSNNPAEDPLQKPASRLPPPSRNAIQSCLPSSLGAAPTPDSGLRVEPRGLYIVVWFTGYTARYHWALFVAQTTTTGIIFHQTTTFAAAVKALKQRAMMSESQTEAQTQLPSDDNDEAEQKQQQQQQRENWRFVAEPEDVSRSPGLLCALKIGVLEDTLSEEWISAVKECVRAADVEDGEEFSCRTWLLAAIYELAEGGFIDVFPHRKRIGRTVEREVRSLARDAQLLGTRMVSLSEMF